MNKPFIALILLTTSVAGYSQSEADTTQSELRLNPELETSAESDILYADYPFLNLNANRFEMNGADWSTLQQKFAATAAGERQFSIVYLGDSHIQADFGGSVLREKLSDIASWAGRGLIIPYKTAGTNQPVDYTFSTSDPVICSRLLKQPWPTEMPFTGIGVRAGGNHITFRLSSPEPFDRITLLGRGHIEIQAVYGATVSDGMDFTVDDSTINLDIEATEVHIRLKSGAVIGGAVLESADRGVFVHSIGNNGATYSSYTLIDHFGRELSQLRPDLILIALGTNEAFGAFDAATLTASIHTLISNIRAHNPDAEIALITPAECYRRTYRGRGRRRRATGMTVNTKVAQARNVIAEYARDHNIALYDTYKVAGGQGAAAHMKNGHVLGRDGVHYTSGGYRLWGSLLSDALQQALFNENIYGND